MKKIISLLLAMIMLLSLSPNIAFAENIVNNNVESDENYDPNDWIDDSLFHGETISLMSATKNRYTILVLDVSGSMSGTQMSKMKEASIYFCQEMIKARGNNSVAIVKFGSSSSLACGFTDDVSALTRTINGLNDGGGTDTAGGLRKAKETYDNLGITDIAERNVILISDGAPNSQSEAEAAFNEMSSDCNVYTLGYNLSSSALSSMNALQNCGFYNVNDTNSIQSSMTKIIEAILAGSTGNIHNVLTNTNSVTVYGNKKSPSAAKNDYRVLPGATLEINSTQYNTDENGQVQIPSITSGSIKVSKTGFVPKTVTAASINESKKIYLQKDEGDAPIINSVMVGNIDVLTQEYKIDLTSEKEITLKADIYWKKGTYSQIYIQQDSKKVSFSGSALTTVLSNNFDVTKDIYIVAVDTEGNSSKEKLNFENSDNMPAIMNDYKLSVGDEISATLPDNIPIIGGGKVGIDIPLIPINISFEDNKFYGTIGFDVAKFSENYSFTQNVYGNYKETLKMNNKYLFENIKDGFKDSVDSFKISELKKKWRKAMYSKTATMGFETDITFVGYTEGYVDSNGKIVFLDGGVKFNPSYTQKFGSQIWITPPVYWEASIKGEIEALVNLYMNSTAKQFSPRGSIGGGITVKGGVGLGVSGVAGASGGGEGNINVKYDFYQDRQNYFALSGSIGAYVKIYLGPITLLDKSFPFASGVIWDHPSTRASLASIEEIDLYNPENYKLIDRSYINTSSEFVANDVAYLFTDDEWQETKIKTNIYTHSEPNMVQFSDGTRLVVWIDDDTSRSDINRTCLYYSYFNGSKWSSPATVHQDSTADFMPEIKIIGDTAYLVWVNTAKVFTDKTGIDEFSAKWDIYGTVFDKETIKFKNIKKISQASTTDVMPTIFGNSSQVCCAWVNNSKSAILDTGSNYSIVMSNLSGSEWSAPSVYASGLYNVDSISGGIVDGDMLIAYSVDTDGVLETVNDKEVYLGANNRITQNDTLDSKVKIYGEKLYWYANGCISERDVASGQVNQIISSIDKMTTDRFDVLGNENGNKAIVYTESEALVSELCMFVYDYETGKWGDKVSLTDLNSAITAFDGIYLNSDNMCFVINKTHIVDDINSNNPYGATDLNLIEISSQKDLSIDSVSYDEDYVLAGNIVELFVDVTNNGNVKVDSYKIEVVDSKNNVLLEIQGAEPVLAGETVESILELTLDDDFVPQKISVNVSTDEDECNYENNSFETVLNYEDISVENMKYSINENSETIVTANIVNRGYGSGDNIVVSLREESYDGNVIATKTVSATDILDTENVVFNLGSTEADDVYYLTIDVDDMGASNNEQYVVIENDYYKIVDGGAVIVNGSAYNDKKIIIPSQLGGYPVVKIDDGAYDSCSNAESIVIPDSVKEIGDYAFSNCEKLKTITIPKNVEKIGEHVFDKCTSLESIKVAANNTKYFDNDGILFEHADDAVKLVRYPAAKTGTLEIDSNIVSIFGGAFDGCTALEKVVINGINKDFQSDYAFINCTSLESIIITGDMKNIGAGMFSNCTALTNVELPDSVISVGAAAFRNCSKLKEIEIGSNVETIAQGAFHGCTALEKMSIPFAGGSINSNGYLGYIFGANSYNENANYVPSGLKEVILTNKDATLQSYAFYNCKNITTVQVNNETVGSHVFNGCSSLTDVIFTYKVITINSPFSGYSGDAVLSGYSSTATETYAANNSITFSVIDGEIPHEVYKEGTCGYDFTWQLYYDHVLEITGTGAMPDYSAEFYGWYPYNSYIREVVIKEGATSVGTNAFYGNSSVRTVTLPNTLKSIKSRAFYSNTSLNNVSIPSNVTVIDSEAFRNCTSLTDIIVGENVTSIGSYAFCGNIGLTEITLPDTVTTIGSNAFYGCMALAKLHLSDSLSSIGDNAFGNCTALETICIPYTVTSINANAFSGHIATFTISGYTDSYAEEFANDNGITFEALDSTIPDEVRASGTVGTDVEWELTYGGVLRITGSGAMPSYSAGSYGWYAYRNSIKSVSISDVTSIGNNAFNGYSKLKTVTMTSSVKRLGTEVFRNCSSLSSITLSNKLEYIGAYDFYGCTALKEIYIPNTVEKINEHAFYGCTQLSKITLNENLSTISSNAFGNCSAINRIEIPYTTVDISKNAFNNHIADMIIAGYNNSCAHDYAIENEISFEALEGNIPEEIRASGSVGTDIKWELTYGGVLTISGIGAMPNYSSASDYAFYSYSTNIKSVVIEKGVLSVGNNAFNGYTKLRNISLPDGLLRVGVNAFYNCKFITNIALPDTVSEIQSYAFYKCSELSEVDMSENVQTIGEYAFAECIMLPELILPYTITNINSNAFNNHVSDFILKGYAGTYVENYAKEQNIPFESIDSVVPDVERAKGTFGTDFAWTLSYNGTLTITGTGMMPSYSDVSNYGWYKYRQYITKAVIDENITSIGNYSFNGFKNLTQVIMNDNLRQIGNYAFSGCSNLTEVVFSEKLDTIGAYAFNNCIRLAEVNLPVGLANIYEYAFGNCTAMQSVEIPYTVVNMNSSTFKDTIAALVIKGYPSTYVEDFASDNGITFEKISNEIPEAIYVSGTTENNYEWTLTYGGMLTIAGKGSMPDLSTYPWHSYTKYIRSVTVEEGATTIGTNAFSSLSKLKAVYLPSTIKTINSSAFRYDVSLENVYMSSGVETIGTRAFDGCTKITSITLPDTVTTLNTGAFENCSLLENIILSKKLSKINDNVFSNCTELKEIMIPETVSYISTSAFNNHILAFIIKGYAGTYAQDYAEKNSINFVTLDVDAPEGVYMNGMLDDFEWSINYTGELRVKGKGTLPDNASSIWSSYSSYIKSIVVEDGVTGLGSYAFNGLRNVKTVKLANSVKSIGAYAFDSNTSLCKIDMGETEIIGSYAFRGCSSLKNVEFPNTIKTISARAFEDCTVLEFVNLPIGITTISEYAFRNCSCLEYVEIPYTVTNVGNGIFANRKSDFVIKGYDKSYIESYAKNNNITFESIADASNAIMISGTVGTDFTWELTYSGELIINGIGAMPDNSSYDWHQYSNLVKKLTVNDGVTGIGSYICRNFTNLTELNISDGVKTIGSYAFSGCSSLKYINLPGKLINISARAFENCYALEDIYISDALKTINNYAFNNCSNLTKIYYSSNNSNWNSITIGTYNVALQNAEIEYNATDLNYVFMGYTQSKSSISARIRMLNGFVNDNIILTTYDDNGKLLSITSQNISTDGGLIMLALPFDDGQTAKCFVWNENMKPYLTINEHTYEEVTGGLQDVVLETPHDYYNSMDTWYTYSFEYEAESIDVTFSSATYTEGCDYIYIYDKHDNLIGTYSGSSLAGVTVNVPGNTIKIRFTTDGSVVYYGFKTESIYVNY